MKAYLMTGDGTRYEMPELLEWELDYGCGTPCDSFRVVSLWDCAEDAALADVIRFAAFQGQEQVFAGVVDECQVTWSAQGCRLEVSGRGMAALLLDNEAQGLDYAVATLEDILKDHVLPYGIQVAEQEQLPAVERFSIDYGSSEWAVLYEFACYHGGVTPRFDRQGQLILARWQDESPKIIHDRVPVMGLSVRDKRYGVLSEIWVREAGKLPELHKVVNGQFKDGGGQCRRMYTMPSKSNYQAMRYQGQYQLDKSAAEQLRLEVDIALPFCAWPGELVRLERTGWGRNGLYRVAQATVSMDNTGYSTRLELVRPDTLL